MNNKDEGVLSQRHDAVTQEGLSEVPFLRDIGLVTTYHCQAACPHCIVEASPVRKEYVRLCDVQSWLQQIANYRDGHIVAIALTGGEPFSNLEHLMAISETAGSLGLLVTAVTNAHWATSEQNALRILESLPAVRLLTFSTDVYHQRAIPLERVKNAFMAARTLGRSCNIAVCIGAALDPETQEIMDYLSGFVPSDAINTARIFPVGRARYLNHSLQYLTSSTPPPAACGMAHAPVIFPDGRVVACFGPIVGIADEHPLLLGNLCEEPLADILDRAEANSILHAIRVWGPRKLIETMRTAGLDACLPQSYIASSVCCACYDLLTHKELVAFLNGLNNDRAFFSTVAYGRAYYLKEARMAELLSRSMDGSFS